MWLIEDSVFPRAEEKALRDALQILSIDHKVFSHSELPSSPVDSGGIDIPRGSSWWISQLALESTWPVSVWGTLQDFSYSHYADRFGELMLNYPFTKLSFHEFCWRGLDGITAVGSLFIRPDDGFKTFEGRVVAVADFDDWVTSNHLLQVRGSAQVIAAVPKEIRAEWRLVILDGKIVTGSQYRPTQSSEVPPAVITFAENAHRSAGPPCRCYVMDVAESSEGLRVIEIGALNCSAFYASNPIEIARSINSMQST
jgi:hypothetical protein